MKNEYLEEKENLDSDDNEIIINLFVNKLYFSLPIGFRAARRQFGDLYRDHHGLLCGVCAIGHYTRVLYYIHKIYYF